LVCILRPSNSAKTVTNTKRALLEHNAIISNLSTDNIISKGKEGVSIPFFKINQLAIAILIAAPVFGTQAALNSLDLSASALAAAGENSAAKFDGPSSLNVNAYADVSSGLGHASGDSDGSFNSRAKGLGTFGSSATFLQSYTVTNDPFEQLFDFTFSIENSSLRVGCDNSYGGDGDSSTGTSAVSYNAKIRLNGVSIWDSFAKLDFNGANIDADFTAADFEGEMLGAYFVGSDYYFGGGESYTFDLGAFSGGEIFYLA
jgi:hypothetical protein